MRYAERYSLGERLLHYAAFSTPCLQKALAEGFHDLYTRTTPDASVGQPVCIFGLPRCGSTMLLELLYASGEFASFTYRHMPFVAAPEFWLPIVERFSSTAVKEERAHGDGVLVSSASPEAFDEILWLTYLRKAYVHSKSRALLRAEDVDARFAEVFRKLATRLVLLEAKKNSSCTRYLSKNNANISRISALRRVFPDAFFLIPFRAAEAQARSLLRQHTRFLEAHERSGFSRSLMNWMGHFDFGAEFRPFLFPNFVADAKSERELGFWTEYWHAAYAHCLAEADERTYFIDFDYLVEQPAASLGSIARLLHLSDEGRLTSQVEHVRRSQQAEDANSVASASGKLHTVYKELRARAVNRNET